MITADENLLSGEGLPVSDEELPALPEQEEDEAENGPDMSVLNLVATAQGFHKGWDRISWTKISNFKKCSASWFLENYATPLSGDALSKDERAAIPGTIVQRLWECVVNERATARAASDEDLVTWMAQQSLALYRTIVFPYEQQFLMGPRKDLRRWFSTPEGQAHLDHAQVAFGLSPLLRTGLQPKFTDMEAWPAYMRAKSLEDYFEKQRTRYGSMLARFRELGLDFQQMISEQFIKADLNGHTLAGGIDFLYNTVPSFIPGEDFKRTIVPLQSIDQLNDGYIIMDGKNQIGPTADPMQLFMYALMIYLRYRKLPKIVGFIDWSKSDFVWYEVKLEHLEQLKRTIMLMQGTAQQVDVDLMAIAAAARIGENSVSVYDVPHLKFNPSRNNCRFCVLRKHCKYSREAGTHRDAGRTYMPRKERPEGFSEEDLQKGEITF